LANNVDFAHVRHRLPVCKHAIITFERDPGATTQVDMELTEVQDLPLFVGTSADYAYTCFTACIRNTTTGELSLVLKEDGSAIRVSGVKNASGDSVYTNHTILGPHAITPDTGITRYGIHLVEPYGSEQLIGQQVTISGLDPADDARLGDMNGNYLILDLDDEGFLWLSPKIVDWNDNDANFISLVPYWLYRAFEKSCPLSLYDESLSAYVSKGSATVTNYSGFQQNVVLQLDGELPETPVDHEYVVLCYVLNPSDLKSEYGRTSWYGQSIYDSSVSQKLLKSTQTVTLQRAYDGGSDSPASSVPAGFGGSIEVDGGPVRLNYSDNTNGPLGSALLVNNGAIPGFAETIMTDDTDTIQVNGGINHVRYTGCSDNTATFDVGTPSFSVNAADVILPLIKTREEYVNDNAWADGKWASPTYLLATYNGVSAGFVVISKGAPVMGRVAVTVEALTQYDLTSWDGQTISVGGLRSYTPVLSTGPSVEGGAVSINEPNDDTWNSLDGGYVLGVFATDDTTNAVIRVRYGEAFGTDDLVPFAGLEVTPWLFQLTQNHETSNGTDYLRKANTAIVSSPEYALNFSDRSWTGTNLTQEENPGLTSYCDAPDGVWSTNLAPDDDVLNMCIYIDGGANEGHHVITEIIEPGGVGGTPGSWRFFVSDTLTDASGDGFTVYYPGAGTVEIGTKDAVWVDCKDSNENVQAGIYLHNGEYGRQEVSLSAKGVDHIGAYASTLTTSVTAVGAAAVAKQVQVVEAADGDALSVLRVNGGVGGISEFRITNRPDFEPGDDFPTMLRFDADSGCLRATSVSTSAHEYTVLTDWTTLDMGGDDYQSFKILLDDFALASGATHTITISNCGLATGDTIPFVIVGTMYTPLHLHVVQSSSGAGSLTINLKNFDGANVAGDVTLFVTLMNCGVYSIPL
jgi:hypothetical protein